ncbi:glutaredoxin family protein [Anthocerotibacter panamensis]|uniref:glutaredoxin family protein n=1 Tax=Anthocerotibacter panamensis TaxID=2857077 RepID=UPI001C406F20|nr:glutaredoxin family protein [Anthocerotibacter panamensis]
METVVVVYTKPDCPLCASLVAKLTALQPQGAFLLELRDISTRSDWEAQFAHSVPVLVVNGRTFPRPSPRIAPERLAALLAPALQRPPCSREEAY